MLGGSNVLALLIILTILCVRKGDDVSDDIYDYSYEDDEDDADTLTVCENAGQAARVYHDRLVGRIEYLVSLLEKGTKHT